MIAYYVHWHYPTTADNELFYGGKDDNKLFHHKENAEKYAKDKIDEWDKTLAYSFDGDLPDDYTICEREIKFEDEL